MCLFVSHSFWSEFDPLIPLSSAQRCRFTRHLRSQDKSGINQTLSLIMRVWVKGGKRGFRLDSPRANLSVTCVIWRSVNTDYLADETRVYINFYPAYPAGRMRIQGGAVSLYSFCGSQAMNQTNELSFWFFFLLKSKTYPIKDFFFCC